MAPPGARARSISNSTFAVPSLKGDLNMAGIPVSAQDINVTSGDISRRMQATCNDVVEFKRFLDSYTADALAAAYPPLSVDDANLIKSAFGELQLVVDTQTANRTFSSRISGMGDI